MTSITERLGAERIATLLDAGLAAWPGVVLDREAFVRALEERVPDDVAIEAVHATDLVLALACARGDARAIAHFERAFVAGVPRVIGHVAKTDAERDEVCQRLRRKLLVAEDGRAPRIVEYSGRGPLGGWLRVAAVREALNLRRSTGAVDDGSDDEVSLAAVSASPDPEAAVVRARHGRELAEVFRESVRALPPDERTLLRLHYLDGLEIEAIGKILGVHRSTASRWLAKTRDGVLKDTRRRLRERLRASASEVESVLRLAHDDLEISLHRALAGSRA